MLVVFVFVPSPRDTVTEYLINFYEQCLYYMARLVYQSKWLRDFVMQYDAALVAQRVAELLALHSLVSADSRQLGWCEPLKH